MSIFKKKSKKKKMTIIKAVELALERLPETFPAYLNPYKKSLESEVKRISGRSFVTSVTVMRRLRDVPFVKCIDSHKSIYAQN